MGDGPEDRGRCRNSSNKLCVQNVPFKTRGSSKAKYDFFVKFTSKYTNLQILQSGGDVTKSGGMALNPRECKKTSPRFIFLLYYDPKSFGDGRYSISPSSNCGG